MAKKNSVKNVCHSAVYFNQMREEVLNRYLGSYATQIPKRTETIVFKSDCRDDFLMLIPVIRKGGYAV